MTRDVTREKADDHKTDSDQEIWLAIRYLDPDLRFTKSDIAYGVTWIVLILLLCIVIFWF